jgi:putative flippase GtrA
MSEVDTLIDRAAEQPALRALGTEREVRSAVKYGIVGVCNVAIDFLLYALLVSAGVWYIAAKALSLTVATANGYTLNRRWTFRAGRHQNAMLSKYVTVQITCYVLNVAVLAALVEGAGMGAITAQAIALPFIAAFSFLAQRIWTFGAAMR